jgi:hypothetical protein
MANERRIGKDLKGSGRDKTKVFLCNVPGGTKSEQRNLSE